MKRRLLLPLVSWPYFWLALTIFTGGTMPVWTSESHEGGSFQGGSLWNLIANPLVSEPRVFWKVYSDDVYRFLGLLAIACLPLAIRLARRHHPTTQEALDYGDQPTRRD
jgi:hypothetical protein